MTLLGPHVQRCRENGAYKGNASVGLDPLPPHRRLLRLARALGR